jgi:Arc/MetJ-type ribon-helix-helix transcriptional regulator
MVQLVTKVDDATAKALDDLIADGQFSTRSEAVRAGIDRLVDESRRVKTAASILAGYEVIPETADELDRARRATIAMIAEEPW